MRSAIWAVLGLLVLSSTPVAAGEVVLVVPRSEVVVVRDQHRHRRAEERRERERLARERAERRQRLARERAERRERRRHGPRVVLEVRP